MDPIVARAVARWPDVPAVYGWLALDRRGNWLIKGERIGNTALREFIARNYQSDGAGRWYFQNGPQRVYVSLAYTPLVVHYEDDDALVDHCGRPFAARATYLDDEGSVLMAGAAGVALLDDRDLVRFADSESSPESVARSEVPRRFGFIPEPQPGDL
ncbi:MAG: DUF2946 family protein [Burkholderiales bacterium]